VNVGHDKLARGFYTAVFSDAVPTIGLAINASKNKLVAGAIFDDLVEEFTLFGDPAMRFQIPPQPDVAISKSAVASNGLMPGSLLTFTLRYSNAGGLNATGVAITDVVPAGLINLAYTSSGATLTPRAGGPQTPGVMTRLDQRGSRSPGPTERNLSRAWRDETGD